MKTEIKLFIIILLGFSLVLNAQNTAKKTKSYKIWISLIDDSKIKGFLHSADNGQIEVLENIYKDDSDKITIQAEQISVIKIRRNGKVWKGAGIGALSGFAVGGLLGISEGDDDPNKLYWFGGPYTAEEKGLALGMPFAIIGSGVGSIIATKRNKFFINGDLEQYNYHLPELDSYALK